MSGDPSPIRIMAVDDHPLLRQGIVGLGFSVRERNKIMSTDPSLISDRRQPVLEQRQ